MAVPPSTDEQNDKSLQKLSQGIHHSQRNTENNEYITITINRGTDRHTRTPAH